jgi:hypothetical protein
LHARAVAAHPRYAVARYRLAASCGMISRDGAKQWLAAPASERIRIAQQLQRACERLEMDTTAPPGGKSLAELPAATVSEAASTFDKLSQRLLDRLVDDADPVRLLTRALRRSERVSWWPRARSMFQRFGPARLAKWLPKSALLLNNGSDYDEVWKRARHGRSWWQLSYNLACYHAAGSTDDALLWLEAALERPGSGQMAGGWLEKDPDLENIRKTPRFDWVVGQLQSAPPADETVPGGTNGYEPKTGETKADEAKEWS